MYPPPAFGNYLAQGQVLPDDPVTAIEDWHREDLV
jgi:hypothetical protein